MPNRLDELKETVYTGFSKIAWFPMQMEAWQHTVTVVTLCGLLAEKRQQSPELAMAAGLLHDISKFLANDPIDHAAKSAIMADEILRESRSFTPAEIEAITTAIEHHSQKKQIDAPLDEILKDADVLARAICDPAGLMSTSRRRRFDQARHDLSLSCEWQA